MMINELWTKCFPGVKAKQKVKFESCKGEKVAVDISSWLHQLCSRAQNAALITCSLLYPPNGVVIETLSSWHKSLTKHSITPYP